MSFLHSLIAIGVVLVFSVNLLAAKIGVSHSPPVVFAALRFTLVALLLLPFFSLRRPSGRLVAAAGGMGAHFLLIFVALYLSDGVGPVVVGLQLYVPFSSILGALVLGEVLGARAVFGIVLAVAGVVGVSFDPIVFNHWPAMGTIILAAFMQALASLMMRGLGTTHPLKMQLWTAVVSVPALVFLSAAVETGQAALLADPPAELLGAVLFTALAGSLLGHGGFFFLIKRYPLALATSITLAVPVVATTLSAVFLDETLTWRIIAGGLVTILGVGLVQMRSKRRTGENLPP